MYCFGNNHNTLATIQIDIQGAFTRPFLNPEVLEIIHAVLFYQLCAHAPFLSLQSGLPRSKVLGSQVNLLSSIHVRRSPPKH